MGLRVKSFPGRSLVGPQPGHYAVSAHYWNRFWRTPEWEKVGEPIEVIGHTIYIFKIDAS